MTSLDPSATDPSTATQDRAGDVISPAPTTAPVGVQTPPQNAFAPVAPYASGSPMAGPGPVGQIRGTGVSILLAIVTFGIYAIVWYYKVHSEMKAHTGGVGLGGGLAVLLALVVSPVMPFLTSSEVGTLYRRAGMDAPVSGVTGLWYFPGSAIIVGPLVWFIKTNGAINSYWRSLGAV